MVHSTSPNFNAASVTLSRAILTMQDMLQDFANQGGWQLDAFAPAFGADVNQQALQQLGEEVSEGNFEALPTIEVRPQSALSGARGVYVTQTDTIYLAQEFLEQATDEQIVAVLLEEVGHGIDARINAADARGDEGDIFSAIVRGAELSDEQLSQLQQEQDAITVTIDGQALDAEAAIITVTNTNDSGAGSLRDAIASATSGDTIAFDISLSGSTITLGGTELDITTSLTIDGDLNDDGTPDITIDGNNASRVIDVTDGNGSIDQQVVLDGLAITGGNSTASGGGISSRETLLLSNSIVTGNTAGDASIEGGGGVYLNGGSLTLENTTISSNTAFGYGGGIRSRNSGIVIVNDSTISNNTSSNTVNTFYRGGGIHLRDSFAFINNSTISDNSARLGGGIQSTDSELTITNSTISGNSSTGSGGGIYGRDTGFAIISNSTISGNSSGNDGGGIKTISAGHTTTISNSTIANNTSTGGGDGISATNSSTVTLANTIVVNGTAQTDVRGNTTFSGVNIVEDGSKTGTDILNVNPLLGDLQDNGGDTLTHSLLPGSPALDASGTGSTTEGQRGTSIVNSTRDIGAFESQGFSITPLTGNGQEATVGTAFDTPLRVQVSSFFGEPIDGGEVTFTVPGSGASATLDSTTVTLDATGIAAATATANTTTGTYTVTTDGVTPANFFLENLAQPTVSISPTTLDLAEGDTGSTLYTFTVSLTGDYTSDVTVNYTTNDGTATAGNDYTDNDGSVTFSNGETEKTIQVAVTGDTTAESDETFTVSLDSATNATLGTTVTSTATIANDDSVSLSINDATANESDGTASFTVSLSAASNTAVTVDYTTADDTAVAGSDYTAASGTLTFAAGVTSQTVTVNLTDDALDEPNETFFVDLTNPNNATLSDSQGQGTLTDNDTAPTLSIDDVTVNENAGTATFTVALSAASGQAITVDYATANDSAIAGSDYTSDSGTLTFAAGVTSQTITINLTDDSLDEASETFFVDLTNPSNATIADSQGQATLTDDDTAPTISIDDVTVNENAGTATFTVDLSTTSGQAVTVDYATADDSALAGSDYTSGSGTLTFAAGVTSQTITVNLTDDALDEAAETFFVDLTNPSNATIADSQGQATLSDDDTAPTISIDDVTVNENAGTTTFTVDLSTASGQAVTVDYATADDSAIAGSDYTSDSGTLTFAAGVTSQTITVNLTDDALDEASETFVVDLTNPSNATIADSQGQATLSDDDTAPTLSIDDVTVNENAGTATFTVDLSATSGQAITVDYATADDSAVAGSDYTSDSGTVTFAAGVTSQTITVNLTDDALDEAAETFFVDLTNPSNATITDSQGQVSITDDDTAPTISIDDVTINENAGTISFDVSLSTASGQAITVDYATADDSALAGSDYTSDSGTLTFNAGVTNQTITITLTDDALDEADETFFINLANPINATIADSQAQGTLTDTDAAPTLSIGDVTVAEGAGTATFSVDLSVASGQTVTVDYATTDSTAIAPTDYTNASGTLIFNPGETRQDITIAIDDDAIDELDETFFVNLTNSSNATVTDNLGQGTVTDNDAAPTLSINDVIVDEAVGTATFTVTLSGESVQPITVDYTLSDTTTTAGRDYTSASGTLAFSAGETSKTITVDISDDALDEPDENFVVDLANPSNATIADTQGQGTITDNDTPPNVSLSVVDSPLAENGGVATIIATLDAASSQAITVTLALSGTATEGIGNDYTASTTTLTIPAETLTSSLTLTALDDGSNENDETIIVDIDSVTNGTESGGNQQVTAEITDDDDVQVVITPILIEATEGGGNGGYLVRLSTIPTNPVTIAFDTGNQVESIAPLSFAADATALTDQTVTLIATDDDLVEGDHEQIISHTVTSADSAYAALSVDSVTTALIDNDIDYSLAVDTTSLSEGEDDSQAITVTVTRSGDISGTSSVDLTLSGTATVGSDYSSSASSNTLSFATGETSQIITLTLLGDIDEEVDETIILNLENGTAPGTATLTDETATITLLNDDASLGIALSDIDFSNNNPGINLRGTSQNDKLRGTPQSDTIRGGRGNDRITSGRQSASFGKDRLFGNAGNDVISGGKGQDRLDGGSGNDRLKGGNNRDLLLGGSGDDRLLGQQGSDILVGGRGDDVIKGGSGIDMIRYTSLNDGQDIIKGFNGDEDLIDLRDIFSLPAFTETSPFKQFQQYVELVQVGSDIDIQVDEDGRGTGTTFTTLATLRNVAIDNISSRNIVIA